MLTKDNWNYTRSWMGEFSPYYLAGARAMYTFLDEHITLQAMVINGWQQMGELNLPKSLGTSVAWNAEMFSISWNTIMGPELPGAGVNTLGRLQLEGLDTRWRFFSDVVVVARPTTYLQFAFELDTGIQHAALDTNTAWHGMGGYVRLLPFDWVAFAFRGELFLDPFNTITGQQQALTGSTATMELLPSEFLVLKLEARADFSSARVFGTRNTDNDGVPVPARNQGLLLAGAVVHF